MQALIFIDVSYVSLLHNARQLQTWDLAYLLAAMRKPTCSFFDQPPRIAALCIFNIHELLIVIM